MPSRAETPPDAGTRSQSTTTADPEEQLEFQFFTLIDGYGRRPPERALWREAVKLRIGHSIETTAVWIVHKRHLTPATVHHIALAVYYDANGAGILQVPQAQMADDCHIEEKTFSRGLIVLKRLGLLSGDRSSRRSRSPTANH